MPWLGRILVALLLLGGSALAQRAPARRPPERSRAAAARPAYMQQLRTYEEGTFLTRAVLKNGLTVLVNEYRSVPVVSILAYARSGPLNEAPGRAGLAGRLARTLFRASSSRHPGVFEDEIRALGGRLESAAAFDHTAWNIVGPANQWKRVLEIQSDALLAPLLGAGERGALDWGGRRVLAAAPTSRGEAELWDLAWGRVPFGATAASGDAALLEEQYRATILAGRLILVVSGDCNAADVLAEVVRLWAKLPAAGREPSAARPGAPTEGFHYRQVRVRAGSPSIELGFALPGTEGEEFAALEVTAAMLGLGDGAILPRRLRDQKRLVFDGRAQLVAGRGAGLLRIAVEVPPDRIDAAEIALVTELEILKRAEPAAVDLARARAQLEREHWLRLETVEGRVAALARHEALGSWKTLEDRLPRLARVTPADVSRVARKYLALERAALVELLPEGAEPRPVTQEVAFRTLGDLLEVATAQEAAAREAATVPALKVPPENRASKYGEVRYPMQKASVLRGPELFIKEDHTAPVLEAGIFFPGGRLVETRDNSGITALMLAAMLERGKETVRDQFQQQLDLYGGRLAPVVEEDYFGYRLTVLSASIESALDLVAGIVKAGAFDADRVAWLKSRQLAAVRRGEVLCGPEQRVRAALFGPFAYGRGAFGSEASVSALTHDAVAAWHKSTVAYRKPIVVLVGDTQGTSLARYFVRNFSGSRYEDVKLPEVFADVPKAAVRPEESRPGGEAQVLAAFVAPPAGDEDEYAMRLVEELATGPNGALDAELRERQHAVEAVALEYRPRLRGGSVLVRTRVRPGDEERAVPALEAALRKLGSGDLLYRDYRTAVNRAVARYWIEQQSHAAQVAAMMAFALQGSGVDEITSYPARLQAVRPEDVGPLAARILVVDRAVISRVHAR